MYWFIYIYTYKPCINLPFGVCAMYFYPQVYKDTQYMHYRHIAHDTKNCLTKTAFFASKNRRQEAGFENVEATCVSPHMSVNRTQATGR